jgi:hypothetical protein
MALLDAKNLSQRQVALDLDTSPSNFNQRILAGSMRPGMIMELNKMLGVDLLKLTAQYEQGESLSSVIEEALRPKVSSITHTSASLDLHEMIVTQNKTISELQFQIKDLITQLKRLIQQDMQKTEQQLEILLLLKDQRTQSNN